MDLETGLMARLADGDEGALAELYELLSERVYTLALRMLQSREEAEEVLQDTFLKLYRKAGSYRFELGSPRAFIYTIARNEALSRLRARSARPAKSAGWEVHNPNSALAAPEAGNPLTRVEVEGALEILAEDDAKLLQLAFFDGYSHAELASVTGMPLGTVKSKLRRALSKLRGHLEEHESP
jgi:RNA polymerase sigma-70 factor, ECF subfamily